MRSSCGESSTSERNGSRNEYDIGRLVYRRVDFRIRFRSGLLLFRDHIGILHDVQCIPSRLIEWLPVYVGGTLFLGYQGAVEEMSETHNPQFEAPDPEYVRYLLEKGGKPIKVVLCGSTRYRPDFERATMQETLKGRIVLSVGMFGHEVKLDQDGPIKAMLDVLHLRKIDDANEVLVINTAGYIGESTRNEIAYATEHGKTIRYLYPDLYPAKENAGNK